MKPTLHIITGPTAVGKTNYAITYAEEHDAEIVSCDALLVYQGMDIGTAKPSPEELARVPHHLIDIHPVKEPYDIIAYVRDAQAAVEKIIARGKSVVVTGGSGFYLRSFFAPVVDGLEISDVIREKVAELYATEGLEGLLNALHESSPEGFGTLDTLNPRRVQRALERCMASGKSLPELQAEFAAQPEPYAEYSKYYILLERNYEALRERVVQRANKMIQDGLIEEVTRLRNSCIEQNPCAASAIGYRESLAYLRGEMDISELVPRIVQNTNQLIKKQRTWFRTQLRSPDKQIRLQANELEFRSYKREI